MITKHYNFEVKYADSTLDFHTSAFDPLSAFIKLSKALNLQDAFQVLLKVDHHNIQQPASEASGVEAHNKELSGALHVPYNAEPQQQ